MQTLQRVGASLSRGSRLSYLITQSSSQFSPHRKASRLSTHPPIHLTGILSNFIVRSALSWMCIFFPTLPKSCPVIVVLGKQFRKKEKKKSAVSIMNDRVRLGARRRTSRWGSYPTSFARLCASEAEISKLSLARQLLRGLAARPMARSRSCAFPP